MLSPNSPDFGIDRLREEGYDLSLVGGELVVRGIPFVDESKRVQSGTLIPPVSMCAGRIVAPEWHFSGFRGGVPCDASGGRLSFVSPMSQPELVARGWTAGLCLVPLGREFLDYHELVTAYVSAIVAEAQRVDPFASPHSSSVVIEGGEDSPFQYADVASVRAGTSALTARLATSGAIGIVGLGGTGSYVLDLVAKTPVPAIHLFDADDFLQHNAFRAPGAATIDDLRACRSKVDHFAAIYSAMHRSIIPHRIRVDGDARRRLGMCGFVFVCIDDGSARRHILTMLAELDVPAIDVGMGLRIESDGIAGMIRVGGANGEMRGGVPASDGVDETENANDPHDPYRANIQIAELNALNAAFAVVAWKKSLGFYAGAADPIAYIIERGLIVSD